MCTGLHVVVLGLCLRKKEKVMKNVANMKKLGTRGLSKKLFNKQMRKVGTLDWGAEQSGR